MTTPGILLPPRVANRGHDVQNLSPHATATGQPLPGLTPRIANFRGGARSQLAIDRQATIHRRVFHKIVRPQRYRNHLQSSDLHRHGRHLSTNPP